MNKLPLFIFFYFIVCQCLAQNDPDFIATYEISCYSHKDSTDIAVGVLNVDKERSFFTLDSSTCTEKDCKNQLSAVTPNRVNRDFNKKELCIISDSASIKDTLNVTWKDIYWDIKEEFRNIGDYFCQLAIGESGDKVFYVWYTEDMPGPYGPLMLFGLPGLIVEVEIQNSKFKTVLKKIEYPSHRIF